MHLKVEEKLNALSFCANDSQVSGRPTRRKQRGNRWCKGFMSNLVLLMAILCDKVNCQYAKSDYVGSTQRGSDPNHNSFISDTSATLTAIYWCATSNYFNYLSFRFSNGEDLSWDNGNTNSCSNVSGLDDIVFTSVCYDYN